jgi:hypothetical protein
MHLKSFRPQWTFVKSIPVHPLAAVGAEQPVSGRRLQVDAADRGRRHVAGVQRADGHLGQCFFFEEFISLNLSGSKFLILFFASQS